MSDNSTSVLRETAYRFAELIIANVVLSFALQGALMLRLFPATGAYCFLFSTLAAVVFWVLNFIVLRSLYRSVESAKKYYVISFGSYLLFVLVSAVVYKLHPTVGYTVLFCITKFMRFVGSNIGTVKSAGIFHIITLFVIIAATLGTENPEKRLEMQEQERLWNEQNGLTQATYKQNTNEELSGTEDYIESWHEKRERETGAMTHDNYVQEKHEEWSGTEDYYTEPWHEGSEDDAMTHDNYKQEKHEEWSGTEDYYTEPWHEGSEDDAMTHDNYVQEKHEEWSGTEDYYTEPWHEGSEDDAMTHDNYVQEKHEEWSGTEDYTRPWFDIPENITDK